MGNALLYLQMIAVPVANLVGATWLVRRHREDREYQQLADERRQADEGLFRADDPSDDPTRGE